jgi:hypothetical protein
MDGSAFMNYMINEGTATGALEADEEEEVEQEGGEEEGHEEYGEEDKNGGTRGPKWKPLEDRCLYEAWKAMSIGPVTGAKQKATHIGRGSRRSLKSARVSTPTMS